MLLSSQTEKLPIFLVATLKTRRGLIVSALALLAFLYILISQVLPLAAGVLALAQDLRASREQIAQARDWEIASRQLQREKAGLKQKIENLVYSQNQDTQLSGILTALHIAAQAQEIVLQVIKPQPAKTFERHLELPIQLELNTRFHALARFINALETSPIIIKIDKLKMSSSGLAANALQVQMTIVVYFVVHIK